MSFLFSGSLGSIPSPPMKRGATPGVPKKERKEPVIDATKKYGADVGKDAKSAGKVEAATLSAIKMSKIDSFTPEPLEKELFNFLSEKEVQGQTLYEKLDFLLTNADTLSFLTKESEDTIRIGKFKLNSKGSKTTTKVLQHTIVVKKEASGTISVHHLQAGAKKKGEVLGEGAFAKTKPAITYQYDQGGARKIFISANRKELLTEKQTMAVNTVSKQIAMQMELRDNKYVEPILSSAKYSTKRVGKKEVYTMLCVFKPKAEQDLGNFLKKARYCKEIMTQTEKKDYKNVVSEMVRGILKGLLHIHSKDIAHLDIKPDNILLTPKGVPQITDFGVSEYGVNKVENVAGTLQYMSMEASTGGFNGHFADLYSLGITAYELLNQELPNFQASSMLTGGVRTIIEDFYKKKFGCQRDEIKDRIASETGLEKFMDTMIYLDPTEKKNQTLMKKTSTDFGKESMADFTDKFLALNVKFSRLKESLPKPYILDLIKEKMNPDHSDSFWSSTTFDFSDEIKMISIKEYNKDADFVAKCLDLNLDLFDLLDLTPEIREQCALRFIESRLKEAAEEEEEDPLPDKIIGALSSEKKKDINFLTRIAERFPNITSVADFDAIHNPPDLSDISALLDRNPGCFKYFPEHIRADKAVAKEALSKDADLFIYAKGTVWEDKEFLLSLVGNYEIGDNSFLKRCSEELRNNLDFCIAVLDFDEDDVTYLGQKVKSNKKFAAKYLTE